MKREFNNLDGQIPVITFPLFWYSLDDPTKIHGSGKNGGPCVSFGSTVESSITDEIFVDVGGARVAVSLQARFRKFATLLLDYDSELTAVFQ